MSAADTFEGDNTMNTIINKFILKSIRMINLIKVIKINLSTIFFFINQEIKILLNKSFSVNINILNSYRINILI